MDKEFDEQSLKALVAAEINDAELYDNDEVRTSRVRAMEYYNGIMRDTPHQENWSKFVSKDVSDVIGWILPGIMRVFTASDRMVDYEPRRPGDEQFADQASDYANFVFWNDNDGYRVLWDATHDSLLLADGIVKTYWDDAEECDYAVLSGMTEDQVAVLMQEQGVEIVAQAQGNSLQDVDPMGNPVEIPTYDLKVKRVTSSGKVKVVCVEPENFLIDRSAISIEDARFTAHRDPHVTRSQLVEMGFDPEIVANIPRYNYSYSQLSEEANARDPYQLGTVNGDKSTDRIELYECYIKADVNNDGIAETVMVYYAGAGGAGEILDWQVWDDDTPFTQIQCQPVPHRFHSQSLATEVMDIQQIKTTIGRQLLNNTYQVNNPQKDIEVGSIINMDELVNPSVGGVLLRKAGSNPVNYNVVPSIMGEALQAIDSMDRVIEMRTGVSRATMALDPEALQNQTATANQNQRDAAYSQVELIARNQAEGWRKVFSKILKIMVKHQDRTRTIRLRDEWVQIDPRYWNANMDAYINVGLGTGSRDRDMAMLNNILTMQLAAADRLAASGMPEKGLEMAPKVRKTMVKIVESAGIKNADSFFVDISDEDLMQTLQKMQEQAGQPTPEVQIAQAKMQADMQIQQAKMAGEQQKSQAEMLMKQQEGAADLQLEQQKMQMEFQLRRYQIDSELSLKREQLVAELALKREQIGAELELQRETSQMNAAVKASASSGVSVGGEPG